MIPPGQILSPGSQVQYVDLGSGIAFKSEVVANYQLNSEIYYQLDSKVRFHPDSGSTTEGVVSMLTSNVPGQHLLRYNIPRGSLVLFTKAVLHKGSKEHNQGWIKDYRIRSRNGKLSFHYSVALKSNPKVIEDVQVDGLSGIGDYYIIQVLKWGMDHDFPRQFKKMKVVI